MAAGWKDALMADTGAPWNIPYVEPSDLVRDYPAADEAQALAIAAGLTATGAGGIGSNVVQTLKDDTFSTSSSTFVDVTGYAVTITPSSATSKVLIVVTGFVSNSGSNSDVFLNLRRGSSNIAQPSAGTAAATINTAGNATASMKAVSITFLDSPEVATAVTYSLQMRAGAGTAYLNRSGTNANITTVSSISAIEVAA
jgi:hypothetical protein